MRNTLVVVLLASGCAVHARGAHGLTRAEYQGGVHLVFTNASPAKMCELRMSSDAQPDYGDNWLPEAGLASGASLKLNVRPGIYKATWSTCATGSQDGGYAGTLWHDTAVNVSADTQLYAYVPEKVAPTKRAPLLGVDYTVVRFEGQAIAPIALAIAHPASPVADDTRAIEPAQPVAKLGAAAFVDPAAVKRSHVAKAMKRPSLRRTHDVANAGIAYQSR